MNVSPAWKYNTTKSCLLLILLIHIGCHDTIVHGRGFLISAFGSSCSRNDRTPKKLEKATRLKVPLFMGYDSDRKEEEKNDLNKKQKDLVQDRDGVTNNNKKSTLLSARQFFPTRKEGKPFPFDMLLDRALDTLEDIFVIARRKISELEQERDHKGNSSRIDTRETIVILGSGWAAHALLKVSDPSRVRIVCVSPSNHFAFTPMLASASVGTVEFSSMTESVRASNPLIDNYIEGTAIDLDIKRKNVTIVCKDLLAGVIVRKSPPPTMTVSYDKLVVAVGGRAADFGVPGASECLRLKSCDDARKLRTTIGECFEYASRPDCVPSTKDSPDDVQRKREEKQRRVTFLIVGGGPTGVELAGEISDLAQDVTRSKVGAYHNLKGFIKVILVHSGSEVLEQFEPELRSEALFALKRRGIDVRLNTYVTRVEEGYVVLRKKKQKSREEENNREKENGEMELPMGLPIWCAGTAPVPFVSTLLKQLPDSTRGKNGRIKVDKWLRPVMTSENNNNNNNKSKYDASLLGTIFVLGDAADFRDEETLEYLPQTAQVAAQQGAYLARLLDRGYDFNQPTPVLPSFLSGQTSRLSIAAKTIMSSSSSSFDTAAINSTATATTTTTTNDDNIEDDDLDDLLETWLVLRQLEVAPGFSFLNLGLLAYLGGGKALSQVQVGDYSLFKWAGSVAFVLWRSVYLVKQVATKNRILVTFDWIKSCLFGRDQTRL